MKLWGIFRFEFAYQVRRVWLWLIFAILIAFAFLFVRVNYVGDALYADYNLNSPFLIAGASVFGGLIWLLLAAPLAGEAAARDVSAGMHPLTYTAPVSKAEYLGGRFLAALALNALILLALPAGILLAVYAPGVDAQVIGAFRPAAYLTAYAFITLPNAFVATAIQFSLATRSGRGMASYLGSLLLIFMGFFVASLLFFKRGMGTLLDPIGIRFIVEDLAHEWTTIEQRVRLVGLEGAILTNRLLWVGVALGALAITYAQFRFAHRTEGTWWWRLSSRGSAATEGSAFATAEKQIPHRPLRGHPARDDNEKQILRSRRDHQDDNRTFGFAIDARKTLAIAWASFRTIALSLAGLALLVGIPMLTVAVVIDQMVAVGVPLIPTTARVISELTGPLSSELSRWVIVPLLTVFFAGELVWREREAGLGEIIDAMPGSDWTPFLGKFLGLALVLVVFTVVLTAAGMLAQAIMGYQNFEIGLYLKILFGLQLPEYLLFAVVALVVHVVVDQKYVGHLAAIMAFVFIVVLGTMLGVEHNLLVYGSSPAWSYTEMRGFGPFLGPWASFKLYWVAWAVLLAVAARLLWVRGRENGFAVRLRIARGRLTGATAWLAGAATTAVVALGGFIFYNTNILNGYRSAAEIAELRAEYERRYRQYETAPQPRLAATNLRVEIYPQRRAVDIRGSYRLVNASGVAIDSIHLATVPGAAPRAVTFDRMAALVLSDEDRGYRIYDLASPLQPGDTLRLDFEMHVERRGFGNHGIDPSIVASGSCFSAGAWFPFVGYQRQRELLSAADRRAHGLEPRPILASLYEVEGREPAARGGGIAFEAVVGTDESQVAVAPGALRRTWTEGGRRYFHYSTDAPIGSEWAFFSADYAVHEGRWNDVAIRIYHHPKHTAHLDRMLRGVTASLDYYTRQFGPYPYRHLTVVENPAGPGTGMHAEASMISHGQGVPFWIPKEGEGSFDFPYAVVAHEMAHQWTLPYALVEGLPFLSEGLAWYSAAQVVKESRGDDQLRQLLAFMRQPYPHKPIRRGEPLLRALDPYLAYRRGPFAMYALSEYVGSDRVNGALRRLIQTHDAPGARLATTLDLYRELKAVTPDSLKPLLHDLFEVNTLWQLQTTRVAAEETEAGAWLVRLDVRARKMVYDSAGVETDVPVDEWMEIGVFAEAGAGGELSKPLYVKKHRIRSGEQTITLTVPGKPSLAGIDPYHVLDWEEGDDDNNIEPVAIESRGRSSVSEARVRLTEYDGVLNTLNAATQAGFSGRFLYMTASSVGTTSFWTVALNLYKGNTLLWRQRAESGIRASGLAYTIIRAGMLTNQAGGLRAIEVTQRSLPLSPRHRIARADVAEVFVTAMRHARTVRTTFEVIWGHGNRQADWSEQLQTLMPDP